MIVINECASTISKIDQILKLDKKIQIESRMCRRLRNRTPNATLSPIDP